MKPKLIIVILIAMLATACGTSVQMSGRYVDDLYYWPGDIPPEAMVDQKVTATPADKKTTKELVIVSEVGENEDGSKTLDNYIYADDKPDWYSDVQTRNIASLADSVSQDTLYYPSEDEETYIVNNYYLDDEDYYSYSDRIRRFQDPYYYDPYWNSSFYGGWGYSPYYSGRYWNSWYGSSWYYDPWYYDPWYYSWGYNPYYYNSWYYGGYYGWYSPYYHYHDHYAYWHNNDNQGTFENNRRSSNPNVIYGGGSPASSVSGRRSGESTAVASSFKSGNIESRRTSVGSNDGIQKSATIQNPQQKTGNSVLTEKRRNSVSNTTSRTTSSRSTETPVQATQVSRVAAEKKVGESTTPAIRSNSYTPSYNKPRTNTRASYNTNRTSTSGETRYTAPSSANSPARSSYNTSRTKSTYQIPSSSGTSTKRYSNSSSTPSRSYNSGSTTAPSRSYTPSRSSSSPSSAPTRSYTPSSSSSSRSYTPSSSSSSPSRSYSSGSSSSSSSSRSSSGGGSSSSSSSSGGGHRR